MLDPKKLIEMLTNMSSMSQATQQSLTQGFMSGAAGMKIDGMGEMEKMMSMMKDMNEKATSGVSELMKQAQQSADEQGAENNGTESDETKENAREAQQGVPKSGVGELMKQAQQSADEQGASSLSFPKEAMDFFNNLQKK